MINKELQHCQHEEQSTCWEYDGRGIPLCLVCQRCQSAKLAQFNPMILDFYNQCDVDEPIEPEHKEEWY